MMGEHTKLPDDVIESAVNGDESAIGIILMYYNSYIIQISAEIHRNDDGERYYVTDQVMYNDLKTHLIECILKFNIHI